VHEVHDVLVLQRLRGDDHRAVEVGGRLGFEAAEQPEEVLVVLAGEPRDHLLSDEVGPMTRGAVVEIGELLSGGEPWPGRASPSLAEAAARW
jgi:hypothetical protein